MKECDSLDFTDNFMVSRMTDFNNPEKITLFCV